MYIIPFLSAPVVYALPAYIAVNFEFPLVKKTLGLQTRVYKSSPDYNATLMSLPGYHIKEEINNFLDKQQIRKDLIVFENRNIAISLAQGTNLFRKGDAYVVLPPGLHANDKAACHWILKHEISHIKNNDIFTMPLIPCISSFAAAVFGTCTMPWFSATLLAVAVGFTANSLFSQWREGKADDFAIENSSNDELLGGRRFLMAAQQMNLDGRQTFWEKIKISSVGNAIFDILHPSLTSRIKKIEKALENKGIVVDKDGEARKIKELKIVLIKK